VQETGQMLFEFAKLWNVPFEFIAIAEKWENITPTKLALRKGEVLIVTCLFKLRNLMDESVTATNPRTMVLKNIRTMNPKVCGSMQWSIMCTTCDYANANTTSIYNYQKNMNMACDRFKSFGLL
jgi:hypothetical protein